MKWQLFRLEQKHEEYYEREGKYYLVELNPYYNPYFSGTTQRKIEFDTMEEAELYVSENNKLFPDVSNVYGIPKIEIK